MNDNFRVGLGSDVGGLFVEDCGDYDYPGIGISFGKRHDSQIGIAVVEYYKPSKNLQLRYWVSDPRGEDYEPKCVVVILDQKTGLGTVKND